MPGRHDVALLLGEAMRGVEYLPGVSLQYPQDYWHEHEEQGEKKSMKTKIKRTLDTGRNPLLDTGIGSGEK